MNETEIDDWKCEGTVLIIDDEEIIRQTMRMMLEHMDFTVFSGRDGAHGIEVYHQYQDEISVVILDMMMPGMRGDEVFSKLQSISPEVKVIVSSGYPEQKFESQFKNKGLAGFLQKPFTVKTLQRTLWSHVQKP